MAEIYGNITTASYVKTGNLSKGRLSKSNKNKPPCTSFKPDTFFGFLENHGVMVCKPRDGATLGEIREYTQAKKGAIRAANPDIIATAREENPNAKLDDIKVSHNDEVKIRETDLPIRDTGNGFGLTVNGKNVYTVQPGDTKNGIANFADVQGCPEYNLQPGTILYVTKKQ